MLNYIPVIGWIGSLIFNMSVVFPLWFIWTPCGYGRHYLSGFAPERFLAIPYWDFVAMAICLSILNIFNPLRPIIINHSPK